MNTDDSKSHKDKVLVVDDEAFARRGMSIYLSAEGFCVTEVANAEEAWGVMQSGTQEKPAVDVAVIDASISPDPAISPHAASCDFYRGVHLVGQIKRMFPIVAVILCCALHEHCDADVMRMVSSGVRGLAYKRKDCTPQELLTAIKLARAGQVLIDSEVAKPKSLSDELIARLTDDERPWVVGAADRFNDLSRREREVISRLSISQSIECIATELSLAPRTVDNNVGSIYEKLGLNDAPSSLRRTTLLAKACMIHDLRRRPLYR
jgi:DNA-binding NarL/FixJ family response regulator